MMSLIHPSIHDDNIHNFVFHVLNCIITCTHVCPCVQPSVSPRASPPPTAPKTHSKPRPPHSASPSLSVESHSHMGSLRHTLGSPDSQYSDREVAGPETVIGEAPGAMGPTHGTRGGVSHKIQQLLNTLKRPRKNRRPVEEYYHDDEMPSQSAPHTSNLTVLYSPPPSPPLSLSFSCCG